MAKKADTQLTAEESKRLEKKKELQAKLTLKQIKFCEEYITPGEFFGNGFHSYVISYNVNLNEPGANTRARTGASTLLTKHHILDYVSFLMEDVGFNDANMDKELFFVSKQNADLTAKVNAIKEYNKLKGRIEEKVRLSVDEVPDLSKMTDEELKQLIKSAEKAAEAASLKPVDDNKEDNDE